MVAPALEPEEIAVDEPAEEDAGRRAPSRTMPKSPWRRKQLPRCRSRPAARNRSRNVAAIGAAAAGAGVVLAARASLTRSTRAIWTRLPTADEPAAIGSADEDEEDVAPAEVFLLPGESLAKYRAVRRLTPRFPSAEDADPVDSSPTIRTLR